MILSLVEKTVFRAQFRVAIANTARTSVGGRESHGRDDVKLQIFCCPIVYFHAAESSAAAVGIMLELGAGINFPMVQLNRHRVVGEIGSARISGCDGEQSDEAESDSFHFSEKKRAEACAAKSNTLPHAFGATRPWSNEILEKIRTGCGHWNLPEGMRLTEGGRGD